MISSRLDRCAKPGLSKGEEEVGLRDAELLSSGMVKAKKKSGLSDNCKS